MAASTLLRSSRLASGVSQTHLAERAQTSQPDISTIESGKRIPTVDTLERLLRQTGHRIIAVPGTGIDAPETAERLAQAISAKSSDNPLRAFLDYSDSLAHAKGINRVVLAIAEPGPTGSKAWDAALAALVDYWLTANDLPKPAWIDSTARYLDQPASPQLTAYDLEPRRTHIPDEFLRRNVWLERSTLESV